jgi:hypothetical protein
VGYWIANWLADAREYEAVGLRYEGSALYPMFAQSVIVAVLLGVSTLAAPRWGRRPNAGRVLSLRPATLCVSLGMLQMLLFSLMEAVERVALGESHAAAFEAGVLNASFEVELTIAFVTAVLVVAVMILLNRAVRSIIAGSRTATRAYAGSSTLIPSTDPVRQVSVLVGSGGVRGPPPIPFFA